MVLFIIFGHVVSVAIQIKAIVHYFPVVLIFESVNAIVKCGHSKEAIELHFPVIQFKMLYKMIQPFKSVEEIPKCDHLNESH